MLATSNVRGVDAAVRHVLCCVRMQATKVIVGEGSIAMSLSVCPLAGIMKDMSTCDACHLWPWLGPLLAALGYLMYFRFCG